MLGIDIGTAAIKLALMRRRRRAWCLQAYAVQPLQNAANDGGRLDGVDLRASLKAALAQLPQPSTLWPLPKNARLAAMALDGTEAMTRVVRLDSGLTQQEIENRVALEAEQYLPFPLEQACLDFCRLPQGNEAGQPVMLVACRRERIVERMDLLMGLGIRPVTLDLDALALCRAANLMALPAPQILLDLGAEGFRLHAYDNGCLVYSRSHASTPVSVSEADASIGGDDLAALAQEVRRAIQLFLMSTACKGRAEITLVGGLAACPGLAQSIASASGSPVSLSQPPSEVIAHARIDPGQWRAVAPQLSLACALAMRVA